MTAFLPTDRGTDFLGDPPPLKSLINYLESTDWSRIDSDERTSAWSGPGEANEIVVLPVNDGFSDTNERVQQALRVIAWIEKRVISEIVDDIETGGTDAVSVRLHPESPSGQAPFGFIKLVVPALRDFVAASGSASVLRSPSLVLPTRRPVIAEAYADQVRMSSYPGSFILTLSMPLNDDETEVETAASGQDSLLPAGKVPFGRLVQLRMQSATVRAVDLAEEVSAGREPLRAFGNLDSGAPNATEIASLASLGGPDFAPFEMRFSRSPRWKSPVSPAFLSITPGQQRVLRDAAEFLRTKQPRSNVTIVGLVVKLSRTGKIGAGEIVVYGSDDDTGVPHRFRTEVSERDYNDAVVAHQNGLTVTVTGDVSVRGNQRRLVRVSSFGVIEALLAEE